MRIFQLIILFSLALSSCHLSTRQNGGSVVGNGMIRYQNDLYDYSFEYDSQLKLTEQSKELVTIDNSTKIPFKSPVSRIDFEVISAPEMNLEELIPYAERYNSQVDWNRLSVTGVTGVYYKILSNTKLSAEYFFLLGQSALLKVSVSAVSEAAGIEMLTPIVDSLSFDTKSPIIHEVVFDPPVVQAGEIAKLRIRATDNLTGIRGTNIYGSVDVGFDKKCRGLLLVGIYSIDSCGEFRDVGGGWYEYDVPTNPRMPANDYVLYPLTIWDGAGNPKSLRPNVEKGVYESGWGDEQDSLPLVFLKVENANPDTSAPIVTNVRFEPDAIKAGESGRLVFNATDDDPAFDITDYCENAPLENWNEIRRTDIPRGENGYTDYSIRICNVPQKRDDGAWEINFTTPKHSPSGKYQIGLSIPDSVNNRSTPIMASILLVNDGDTDLEGPKFLGAKPAKSEYRPGETGTILFKITDNLSDITRRDVRTFDICDTGLTPLKIDWDDKNDYWRAPLCDSQFRHVEDNWYAVDFRLGENIPTGEYWLPRFFVEDSVGNVTTIAFNGPINGSYTYRHLFQQQDTEIPVVKFKVVR